MKLKIRIISLTMAFAIMLSSVISVNVYADEKPLYTHSEQREITGLEIIDLAQPVAGRTLADAATVRSAEGVVWKIPVIWVDENGNVVTFAEEGKKYYPTFVYYVPSGFKVKKTGSNGEFSIKLPGFLIKMYGQDNVVFVEDPSKNITYITGIFSPVNNDQILTNSSAEQNDSSSSTTGNEDSQSDQNTDSVTCENPEVQSDPYREVYIHCAQNTIMNIGEDNLAWFVNLIKNELEPRAVKTLIDGFPCYLEAAYSNEISEMVGLFIYDSTFEDAGNEKTLSSAVAYANGSYKDGGNFLHYIGINTNGVFVYNHNTELYEINSDTAKMDELENTMVHELMHAFMQDYTRVGMNSYDWPYEGNKNTEFNSFPKWFVEGTATSVENAYQYHKDTFDKMKDDDGVYTQDLIKNFFADSKSSLKRYLTDYNGDNDGAYVGGYLAVVYLSQAIAKDKFMATEITSDVLKQGLNYILEELHKRRPLNDIIKEVGYGGISDFEDKLFTEDSSLETITNYLNYLDGVSKTNGSPANGSILLPLDTTLNSTLKGRTETSSDQVVLKIEESQKGVVSDISDENAKKTYGSYHAWDETDSEEYQTKMYNSKVAYDAVTEADGVKDNESGEPDTDAEMTDDILTEAEPSEENTTDPAAVTDPVDTDIQVSEEGTDIQTSEEGTDIQTSEDGTDILPDQPAAEDIQVPALVTDPVVTDPVVTDPIVTDPVVAAPVETDPVVTDPVVTEPVITAFETAAPVATDPVTTDPTPEQGTDIVQVDAALPSEETTVAEAPAETQSENPEGSSSEESSQESSEEPASSESSSDDQGEAASDEASAENE